MPDWLEMESVMIFVIFVLARQQEKLQGRVNLLHIIVAIMENVLQIVHLISAILLDVSAKTDGLVTNVMFPVR